MRLIPALRGGLPPKRGWFLRKSAPCGRGRKTGWRRRRLREKRSEGKKERGK